MSQYARYPSLNERSVFITGGGSGIGASLVREFAAQGSRVGFVDIALEPSRRLVDEIAAAGHTTPLFNACDLRDIAALRAAIAEVGAAHGPITALVNNAAHDERPRERLRPVAGRSAADVRRLPRMVRARSARGSAVTQRRPSPHRTIPAPGQKAPSGAADLAGCGSARAATRGARWRHPPRSCGTLVAHPLEGTLPARGDSGLGE